MRKISLFLNVAGAEAQRIFGTFTFVEGTDDPKKYADVINKFTNFCMPKKNLVYERYVFNICVQKEGQNVDSYVTQRQMQVIQEKGSACGGKETEPVNVIKHGRKGNCDCTSS